MKIRLLIVALFALLAVGCNKPKAIKDDDLRKIFEEVFLSNAYYSSKVNGTDSMDLYNPILEKYGYTRDDLAYTIANFSRRKSSRISDVIDDVTKSITDEYTAYEQRVAVLDTIDIRAMERFKHRVLCDSVIVVRKTKDTTRLRIVLPAKGVGSYRITYSYLIDSLDQNRGLRTTANILDSTKRSLQAATNWLSAGKRKRETLKIESVAGAKSLQMVFGNYTKESKIAPNIRIDSLEVFYYIPKAQALDSLYRHIFDSKTDPHDTLRPFVPKDRLALRVHSPWLAPPRDSLPGQ